ncbi:MAG: hypothetical protein IPK03_02095 [Bacteroidetes bacterium]|nr:hypothetical protein [Bacteroidota bacterium]
MKKLITIISFALLMGMMSLKAQTTCPDDKVAYVNSKNTGGTGAINLTIGMEEKASQAYHYAGPGKVSGARVYGTVTSGIGVFVRVSLFAVDANDRPTGSALAVAPLRLIFSWSPNFFDVNFSPAVSVNSNFAIVTEVVNVPGWGNSFALTYTGNGEGKGEDLASLAGTSTGNNWASAMTTFTKDGDFYMYPRMTHFNTPQFSMPSSCVSAGASVQFANSAQITKSAMFNRIAASGYSGSNYIYTWNFGDGSAVSMQKILLIHLSMRVFIQLY